ncbi:hypothetical protein UFOVP965_86 [uncultured Caudovirales phage]|uniref:Uncharacterized protein n=1 Tax=uncultured Caudovirales phage TaxID=2100421 RepID=A0A6J5PUI6_9CAUD|nr:hypothetical protein UFOVP965_86 [uncultured Caudovirales phage]CAB4179853.1 hypothetical protein UFOVP1035_82 [uncultured Caudovirales phage]CAB4188618.1 hypothetical protein UFOVP1181_41 [uncultured Caudovirales phage]
MVFLMFIEGVLRTSSHTPIYQGLGLYRLLADNNRVVLLSENKDRDDVWLRQHKINKIDDLIGRDIPFITDNPELRQVEYCRSQGPVEAVITSNPVLVKELLEIGITTIAFLHPSYIKEEFRPDSRKGMKPWADITAEIATQQDAFKDDPRVQ